MQSTGPEHTDEHSTVTADAPVDAIVSQDEFAAKGITRLKQTLPTPARFSVLGLVLVLIWWGWPWASDSHEVSQAEIASAVQAAPLTNALSQALPTAAPASDVVSPTLDLSSAAQAAPLGDQLLLTPTLQSEPILAQPDTIELAAPLPTKVAVVLVPTPTPTATPTSPPEVVDATLPQVRIIPAVGIKLPPTRPPRAGETVEPPTPTPVPLPIEPGRLWSSFTPRPPAENDHFWVGSPFLPSAPNHVGSPSYQFGSTAGDRYRPHHGLDISNPMGTPVLAAVEGVVVHAGMDDVNLLGPYGNFYGNTVVIQLDRRLVVGDGELDVYLLYGHLSQVMATVGQRVMPEDVVGAVGMTGIAIGPHLHVEMRLGANTYRHSVNPYLWLRPLGNTGAVAVRLLTADGRTWPGARLTLARFEGGRATWARQIETYLDTENIGPDPAWGENGAMDGAPPGAYVIVGTVNGESIRADLTVNAGETTFVEIRTRQ